MTIEQIEKLLNNTKYDINLSHKESLLKGLIEKKEKNIFNFNLFKIMNIKYIASIAAAVLLIALGIYSYSIYSNSKLYSSLNVNKVHASSNDMPDYETLQKGKEGEIVKQKGTDYLAISRTENGQTVYYIWKKVSNNPEKEAEMVIAKANKGEYQDSTVSYDVQTGKTTITIIDKNNITDNNSSGGSEPGQGTDTGVKPNTGSPTKDNANKDLLITPEYTKCLNTQGSMVMEIYPPICVYKDGTQVAAQYK